jgi:hypothetical protein
MGNLIIFDENYNNWKVVGSDMFEIELQFDVRINCELSKSRFL